jgi:hypothetical protein
MVKITTDLSKRLPEVKKVNVVLDLVGNRTLLDSIDVDSHSTGILILITRIGIVRFN